MANFNAHKPYLGRLCGRSRRNCCCSFISWGLSGGMGGRGGGFFEEGIREEAVTLQYHHLWHEPTPILYELVINLNNAFGCISRRARNCFVSLRIVHYKLLQIQNWRRQCPRLSQTPFFANRGGSSPTCNSSRNIQDIPVCHCAVTILQRVVAVFFSFQARILLDGGGLT